jgi:2-keto-4-pentenoate hydratase
MSEALQTRRMAMLADAGCTREEALAFIREVRPAIEMPADTEILREAA